MLLPPQQSITEVLNYLGPRLPRDIIHFYCVGTAELPSSVFTCVGKRAFSKTELDLLENEGLQELGETSHFPSMVKATSSPTLPDVSTAQPTHTLTKSKQLFSLEGYKVFLEERNSADGHICITPKYPPTGHHKQINCLSPNPRTAAFLLAPK